MSKISSSTLRQLAKSLTFAFLCSAALAQGTGGGVNAFLIRSKPIQAGAPGDGQCLVYSAGQSKWLYAACGSGTVTSVGLSLPAMFTVSGTPVTSSGTLAGTLVTQSANLVFAGPSSGSAASPAFRALAIADLPASVVLFTGTPTTGNCASWASATAIQDSGAACGGGGTPAFSAITTGTNTAAAMIVGTGATLTASGTGTIAATSVPAAGLGAGTIGNNTSGNAATATALAATPTLCAAGHYALGVLANGNATGCTTASGGGTVTSVALALPSIFSVSGSPVTTSGTLTGALVNQSANGGAGANIGKVFAGPQFGGAPAPPTFRPLEFGDAECISDVGIVEIGGTSGAASGNLTEYNGSCGISTSSIHDDTFNNDVFTFSAGATVSFLNVVGDVSFQPTIQFKGVLFASLSACNTAAAGNIVYVTNSTTATWGATITGGGTNKVMAFCDGSHWTVFAK